VPSGYFDETTYDLEISTQSDFSTIDFVYEEIDTTVFTVIAPLEEVEYYWRVKAIRTTDSLESDYSETWSFNVDATAPDVPLLLSPQDLDTVDISTPTLVWSEESKASPVFYTVQVDDDSLFVAGPQFYEYADIYDTSFTVPDELTDTTFYYWRVRAADEVGHQSDWQDHPFAFFVHSFICGDVNSDGVVELGDAIYLLNYLFKNGPAPIRPEAGDVNLDTVLELGDAIYLLNYLFKDGPPPCEPE
jgi:hypothetical protein